MDKKKLATPVRKEIEQGVQLKKVCVASCVVCVLHSALTPLFMFQAMDKKKLATPVRKEIEQGVQLKKVCTMLVTLMLKVLGNMANINPQLRDARRKLATPVREGIKSGVQLKKVWCARCRGMCVRGSGIKPYACPFTAGRFPQEAGDACAGGDPERRAAQEGMVGALPGYVCAWLRHQTKRAPLHSWQIPARSWRRLCGRRSRAACSSRRYGAPAAVVCVCVAAASNQTRAPSQVADSRKKLATPVREEQASARKRPAAAMEDEGTEADAAPKGRGRPKKAAAEKRADEGTEADAAPKGRGRPKKAAAEKPADEGTEADAAPKGRGRPKKAAAEKPADEDTEADAAPKGRGRPKKAAAEKPADEGTEADAAPKGRGRPKMAAAEKPADEGTEADAAPKGRGRPRKVMWRCGDDGGIFTFSRGLNAAIWHAMPCHWYLYCMQAEDGRAVKRKADENDATSEAPAPRRARRH
jgi:hypothetical protein